MKIKFEEHSDDLGDLEMEEVSAPERQDLHALLEGSFLVSQKMLSRVRIALQDVAQGNFELIVPTKQPRTRRSKRRHH